MTRTMHRCAALCCLIVTGFCALGATLEIAVRHQGMCDASATILLNENRVVNIDGTDCRKLEDPMRKGFRSVTLHLPLGRGPRAMSLPPAPFGRQM